METRKPSKEQNIISSNGKPSSPKIHDFQLNLPIMKQDENLKIYIITNQSLILGKIQSHTLYWLRQNSTWTNRKKTLTVSDEMVTDVECILVDP